MMGAPLAGLSERISSTEAEVTEMESRGRSRGLVEAMKEEITRTRSAVHSMAAEQR